MHGVHSHRPLRFKQKLLCLALAASAAGASAAPAPSAATAMAGSVHPVTPPPRSGHTTQPGMVVASGTVPDEGTRQMVLARLRDLYGAERVVDQMGVAPLPSPPQWSQHVAKMLSGDLKEISKGQLTVRGNLVEIRGEVSSDAQRQAIGTALAAQLGNPTYTVRNSLRVSAAGQDLVDAALTNRTIEFETGSAQLTPKGQSVLDDLVPVLVKLPGRRFEVIGHTDGLGSRATNVALSLARAESVRAYLAARGLAGTLFTASGVGPDRPVASNETADGRARNRRIEFRVGQ